MARERVLHILAPARETDSLGLHLADCGHNCATSPRTRALLADESLDHFVTCLLCYLKEVKSNDAQSG